MTAIEEWNKEAANALRKAADEIAKAPPPKLMGEERISFAKIASDAYAAIERVTQGIDRDRAIYIITLDEAADPAAFRAALTQERGDKSSDLKLPQLNPAPVETDVHRVVYVGSSCATTATRKKTTAGRLRQHLVQAPRGTYALNLSRWTGALRGGIVVQVFNYPEDVERDVVVAVEDQLSQHLSPICGRRGIQR